MVCENERLIRFSPVLSVPFPCFILLFALLKQNKEFNGSSKVPVRPLRLGSSSADADDDPP